MIAHIVLFRPRPELSTAERRAVLEAMRAAAAKAPSVRRCRVGRRIKHGLPGYEGSMRDDYEYAAVLEFDDENGLRAYLQHPAHRGIGEQFASAGSAALAYDYELVEVEDAARLVP
jgi:hypothetical protein